MTENTQDLLKWDVKQRLTLLEATVFWTGELVTGFLTSTFSISRMQASNDISLYLSLRPDNLRYDRSLKRYVITEYFQPLLISGSPQECFQVLQATNPSAAAVVTLMSNLPGAEVVTPITRNIDVEVLRPVLKSARFGLAIDITYQSMNRQEPSIYRVQPHTLVYDGLRWHIRAYSQTHDDFRNFVLARVHKAVLLGKPDVTPPEDLLWKQMVKLEIGPHPGLNPAQKQAVERDYGMVGGRYLAEVRAALVDFFLQAMRIGKDDIKRDALSQPLVLLNRKDLLGVMCNA